ncbi:endonuclease [Oscillospiraceae bacterium HV4-5-C5C]|nr:endonuclease [Oscillospiraceae bacterium HV4-5-C5C]
MSNVKYNFSDDGTTAYGELPSGEVFVLDADMLAAINGINFYIGSKGPHSSGFYVIDCNGRALHDYLFEHRDGFEIDHINLDTLDNRRCNIRYCTHQQNQMNQPLQQNNTSGVSGVSYYPSRHKFRARIKVNQHEIHLGYYDTFEDAVMARNVGMLCMFGQYGRYNDVGRTPEWIKNNVADRCARFEELSQSSAFFDFWRVDEV